MCKCLGFFLTICISILLPAIALADPKCYPGTVMQGSCPNCYCAPAGKSKPSQSPAAVVNPRAAPVGKPKLQPTAVEAESKRARAAKSEKPRPTVGGAAPPPPKPPVPPAVAGASPPSPEPDNVAKAAAAALDKLTVGERQAHPELVSLYERIRDGEDIPSTDLLSLPNASRRNVKQQPVQLRLAFLEREDEAKAPIDDGILTEIKQTEVLADGRTAPWSGKRVKVQEFRGKSGDPRTSVNTDRDVRVVYEETKGGHVGIPEKNIYPEIEIPRKYWKDAHDAKFAEASGYTEEKLLKRASPDAADVIAWRGMPPGPAKDQEGKRIWTELHGHLAGDSSFPHAIPDLGDQGIDPKTGEPVQLRVANAETLGLPGARLEDAHRVAEVCKSKAKELLAVGDHLEAAAQIDKYVDMYRRAVTSLVLDGKSVAIDPELGVAFEAVHSLFPYDVTAEIRVNDVLRKLSELPSVRSLGHLADRLAEQIEALDRFKRVAQ